MYPSRASLPTTEVEASVTSLINLSTAYVWQGKSGMSFGNSFVLIRVVISSVDIFFVAGGSVTWMFCQLIIE